MREEREAFEVKDMETFQRLMDDLNKPSEPRPFSDAATLRKGLEALKHFQFKED